ncbi:hypothetical protein AMTR_s00027p00041540 [Amborella trichopoda]|uniref:Uncharacterized protein n=1 Tax=Amborella trichopoda TaxID=13333 RepID=W1PSA6_AMBTC|nr:hypothetical protein AMTR_s00027p00041540 [Amborella trichopoda]
MGEIQPQTNWVGSRLAGNNRVLTFQERSEVMGRKASDSMESMRKQSNAVMDSHSSTTPYKTSLERHGRDSTPNQLGRFSIGRQQSSSNLSRAVGGDG